jgi:hypothetical protein
MYGRYVIYIPRCAVGGTIVGIFLRKTERPNGPIMALWTAL